MNRLTVSLRDWVREDVGLQKSLHVPFGGAFCFPGPEDPPSSLFKGVQLGFDKVTNIGFVGRAEGINSTRELAITAADVG